MVREPNSVRFFLYGQEGNVLGRPKNYINANEHLTDNIIENLRYNASSAIYEQGHNFEENLGVCRPGKDLSGLTTDWKDSQRKKDGRGRVDFINQIAACDSSAHETQNQSRVQFCPTFVLDTEDDNYGNYTHFKESNPFVAADDLYNIRPYKKQNMCGNEASSDDANPFDAIESDPLRLLASILEPMLIKDACFKRAGAPCFTDLDCAPNRLHGAQMQFLSPYSFGGSQAEYEYWSEELVCSQHPNEEFAFEKNRCCREIGKDFTMYSKIEGPSDDLLDYLGLNEEQNPDVETYPGESGQAGYLDSSSYEYSRFTIVDMITSNSADFTTTEKGARSPLIHLDNLQNPVGYQWQSFQEAGEKTCCGGGWIRKFADGTHDWIDFKKLYLNHENFQCLNYVSPLDYKKPDTLSLINWKKEFNKLCLFPLDYGCVQWGIYRTENFLIQAPHNFSTLNFDEWKEIMQGEEETYGLLFDNILEGMDITNDLYEGCAAGGRTCGSVDTTPNDGICVGNTNLAQKQRVTPLGPYIPLPLDVQGDLQRFGCTTPLFGNATTPVQFTFSLPVYIGRGNNIQGIQFKFFDANGEPLNGPNGARPLDDWGTLRGSIGGAYRCGNNNPSDAYGFADYFDDQGNDDGIYNNADRTPVGAWCVHRDNRGRDVLKVAFNKYSTFGGQTWDYGSIRIEFNAIGTRFWQGPEEERQSVLPGNDLYYLSKLGRLELLGIPQIYYEPLYCTHNYDKLLPGLYDENFYSENDDDDRGRLEADPQVFTFSPNRHGQDRFLENIYDEDFEGTDHTRAVGNSPTGYFMYANKINHPPIFSSHEFTCCHQLGQKVSSYEQCCSGYAKLDENYQSQDGQTEEEKPFTCKLPLGTNLNVYFNRFVSNEGLQDGEFSHEDFIPETGEIKFNFASYNKLVALGEKHCDLGSTIRGGIFGLYGAKNYNGATLSNGANSHPDQNLRYSFADEMVDDESSEGKWFQAGYHWNHHVYCGSESE